jgi:hypothetical protein
MEVKKIYELLYPDYFNLDNYLGIIRLFYLIVLYVVSLGFGTLLTILLSSLPYYATSPFEIVVSSILILFLILLWLCINFVMKGIFIFFNLMLYLVLFTHNNFYYPYLTLIMIITILLPLVYNKFKQKTNN